MDAIQTVAVGQDRHFKAARDELTRLIEAKGFELKDRRGSAVGFRADPNRSPSGERLSSSWPPGWR